MAATPETRYLLILTKRLLSLIESLGPGQTHEDKSGIYVAHASARLE